MKTNKVLNNERGQMTIEMLLIGVLILSFMLFVSNEFQSKNLLANLVEGPQEYLIGMAENGVWKPSKQANAYHPNLWGRHMSIKGDAE